MASPVIDAAEKEFGEPFADIVRGFAEMGYSMAETSKIIGYKNRHGLRAWIRRSGMEFAFIPGVHGVTFREAIASSNRRRSPDQIRRLAKSRIKYRCEHDGVFAPIAEHADRLGISRKTVYWRIKTNPDAGPEHWLRPAWSGVGWHGGRDSRVKDDHAWRKA